MKNLPLFYCITLLWTTVANGSVYVVAEFDEKDATRILEEAFQAHYDTIRVPYMGKDWILGPIEIKASNKTIIFDSGVIVMAKTGAFGRYDKLFEIIQQQNLTIIGYGATWRMRKEEYTTGEWRHALSIVSCENINIYGLTIKDSGGDGIKIGRRGQQLAYSKNIHIRDCILDNNRRQGISVISVDSLLIENCILKNTNGTAPQAGIDFEPNYADERLRGITMRNVDIHDNTGFGIQILLPQLNANSQPISFNIENCRVWGNVKGGIRIKHIGDKGVSGTINLLGCVIENNSRHAFQFENKSSKKAKVNITNCTIRNSKSTPILISASGSKSPGGIVFTNTRIVDSSKRPFLIAKGGVNVFDISGDVTVNNANGAWIDIGSQSENITLEIKNRSQN